MEDETWLRIVILTESFGKLEKILHTARKKYKFK